MHQFRNYDDLDLLLSPGFNVLTGANGQGKTNLLEALHWISTTRLLRGQKDAEAIAHGSPQTAVHVTLRPFSSRLSMTLERGSRKRAALDGTGLSRAADLIGKLRCVSIGSGDLAIVQGEPAERRSFADLELSSQSAAYLRHLTLYKRALEQRNSLLKQAREEGFVVPEIFEPWEEQLAEHGSRLRTGRLEAFEELERLANRFQGWLGQGEALSLSWNHRDEPLEMGELATLFRLSRNADIQRGSTSVGPHRDDLVLNVNGREARWYASQGQQRTTMISIKLATLERSQSLFKSPPLLLLDDILSDLDERRRRALVEIVLAKAGQAMLTCTEPSIAGASILAEAQVFEVDSGTVKSLSMGVE